MVQSVDELVGRRLRALRIVAGIKQTELSEVLGISYQQIQKYETGKDKISIARLYAVAEAFKVPVTAFFETDAERQEPLAHNRQALTLMRYFDRIPDDRQRQLIVDVVKSMAEKGE